MVGSGNLYNLAFISLHSPVSKPQRKPPRTLGGAYAPSTDPPVPPALPPSPPRCPPGSSSAIASSFGVKSTAVDSVATWVLRLSRDGHIGFEF